MIIYAALLRTTFGGFESREKKTIRKNKIEFISTRGTEVHEKYNF